MGGGGLCISQYRGSTHPGVVEQAGDLLVTKQGEDFRRCTGCDGEIVEQQPVRAAIGRAGGGRGRGQPIGNALTGKTAQVSC